jgi:hypothetical protein
LNMLKEGAAAGGGGMSRSVSRGTSAVGGDRKASVSRPSTTTTKDTGIGGIGIIVIQIISHIVEDYIGLLKIARINCL